MELPLPARHSPAGGGRTPLRGPDLIGFGKSDKPAGRFTYTYRNHLDWLREALFDRLDLHEVTLVCHDWGGALGLPLLAAHSGRFRRVVAYLQGVRQFPLLIPISPQDENTPALREAWAVLESLDIPFLCAFSDQDHITRGDHSALSGRIPGAKGQSHISISNAGHFVQEGRGPAFAAVIAGFIRSTAKKHAA